MRETESFSPTAGSPDGTFLCRLARSRSRRESALRGLLSPLAAALGGHGDASSTVVILEVGGCSLLTRAARHEYNSTES
jgi:hypothetical protein